MNPWRTLGILLAGDLTHCPHTPSQAHILQMGCLLGLQLGGVARDGRQGPWAGWTWL